MISLDQIKLQFSWRCPLSETHEGSSLIQDWDVTARTMNDAFEDEQPIGHWRIVIIPPEMPNPEQWLADQNSDVQRFQHLWDEEGYVRSELCSPWGIMLVVEAELSQGVRGDGLGLVLTGMVVHRLAPAATCIALHPYPLTFAGSREQHDVAVGKIQQLWARYGARKLSGPGDLWIIDVEGPRPRQRLVEEIAEYGRRSPRHASPTIG